MISSALTPPHAAELLFSKSVADGVFQTSAYSRSGNPRITLNGGEVFINGTHASNTATVDIFNNTSVRVSLLGIETRDFNILEVDSIRFLGRKGNDQFTNHTTLPSRVFGNEGNDSLTLGLGDDFAWGGAGHDTIWGMAGNDVLRGESGNDTLYGNSGDDWVYGGNGVDTIFGDAGNDLVTGDAGNDRVRGGAGDDAVHGWTGDDRLWGDHGNDYVFGQDGEDILQGGHGSDTLFGGNHDDELYGASGADTLHGQSGDDRLFGDSGDDHLRGGSGHDRLTGGSGNDVLRGEDGNDQLSGSSGKDVLSGGNGRDVLLGANDNVRDTLSGDNGQDHIFYYGNDAFQNHSDDLRLRFVNGTSNWTTAELQVINVGLQRLHNATGNNRLIKDLVVGKDLTLEKYQSLPGGAAALNYMTINTTNGVSTYDRVIRFADWNESSEPHNQQRILAFVHEVAHNFDNPFEYAANPRISWGRFLSFRSKSGWTQNPPNTTQYLLSGDGEWWYRRTAEFYRPYATINPAEDWATMWELFFDPTAPQPDPASNLGQKLQALTNFINDLK